MGTKEKLFKRFLTLPSDFTWDEVKTLLTYFGYSLRNKGNTSGSRFIYVCEGRKPLLLHKHHPGKIIKKYALKQLYNDLKEEGLI